MITLPPTLPIPDEVLDIARRLEGAGHETWCVGGAVRDNLLGLDNKDFDLATAARPDVVQQLFRRTVPLGIEHGTVGVLDRRNTPHEVTTFRRDVRTDGRHAVVAFGATLWEDLARRDFTINAIAYHPLRHEWQDPFDGVGDLTRGLVRAVGEPAARIREDYLRILRAMRFATRFGFQIEPGTWVAAKALADGLSGLSAERVRDEWFRGLTTARRAGELADLWFEVGALQRWLPEIAEGAHRDALDRVADRDPVLLTALLSGDPAATLTRLRTSNADVDRARRIAARRADRPDPDTGPAIRRWMAAAGPVTDDLVALWRAMEADYGARLARAVDRERAAGVPLTLAQLAVSGTDLQEAGVPAGPQMGATLRKLLEAVLDDPRRNTREQLLALARAAGEAT